MGRTPRELLESVTVEEIVEAMAFERLEPFGALHLEAMLGQVCATIANVNRDPKRKPQAWAARDFMTSLARALDRYRPEDEPVMLDDPEAMSRLIKASVFGVKTDG